jgi:hypothetical protein
VVPFLAVWQPLTAVVAAAVVEAVAASVAVAAPRALAEDVLEVLSKQHSDLDAKKLKELLLFAYT